MAGNPSECRLHAVHCSQLAEAAATPEARQDLLALAETWRRLAAELESDQALLQTICELEVGYREPYEIMLAALHIRSSAA
jgi:hypothetical protein